MKLITDDICNYVSNLEDVKPEFTPIHIASVLSFYRLRGRTTNLLATNLEVIPDLHYLLRDPYTNNYIFKEFKGYDIETLFFYRPTLTFSGEDAGISNLRRWVQDGNVWILMNSAMIKDTTVMLERLYKSQFKGVGKVDYRIYIELLKLSLDYEDYKDYGTSLTGFRTMCNQYEKAIKDLWEKAYQKNQKN